VERSNFANAVGKWVAIARLSWGCCAVVRCVATVGVGVRLPRRRKAGGTPALQIAGGTPALRMGTLAFGRSAYTLLEVILVLALTTVILGLIGMALHVHLGVADKCGGQVAEAQLARTLLQRIAEDLRNSVPYTATSGTASSTASGTSTGTTTSTSGGTSTASGTSTTGSESGLVIPSGVCGSAQCLQMDTSRRARPVGMAKSAGGDNSLYIPLGDVKTVTYSLGNSAATAASPTSSGSADGQTGLYRRELDRAAYTCAMQQGQSDILSQSAVLLAPEVVKVQFTYYGGTVTTDTWDSSTQGGLPCAVKVAIMLRRQVGKTPNANAATPAANFSFATYDMLVDLPNSQVQSSQDSGQSSGGTSTSSGSGTTTQ
jgi:hypothetical protein